MVSMLVSVLFGLAFVLSVVVLVDNCRRYGRDALALRGQLQAGAPIRQVRYRVVIVGTLLQCDDVSPPESAVILRPDFNRQKVAIAEADWRAAA